MKRIQNITSLTTAFILLVMLGSCKKYLDQQPITEVGPEMVFKDVATTRQALAGVYNRLAGDNAYGLKLALHYPVDEDILMGPSGNNDDRRAMAHYSLTTLNSELPAPFNQMFEGIAFANICIDEIPKMTMYTGGSEQEQKQLRRMYGEALTLRAQFYFDAIRNWGDLPEHFIPSHIQAPTDPFPSRVDRDLLYTHILDDLEEAATLIPWRNEVTGIGDQVDERITKGAVKGLRARIALSRAGWALRQNGTVQLGSNSQTYYQIARNETNDIITSNQHALHASYRGLWKDIVCARGLADPNGELMLQVTAIGAGSVADSKFGYANGPRVNGLGNSFVNPLPHYMYLFDSTDTRRDVTIAPYNVAVDGATKIGLKITDMRDGKYRRDWITPAIAPTSQVQYFGLKWQLMRYSDILLMFAEAENELNGPTAAAYNAINMVRRRGYGKPVSTPDVTVDIPAGLSKADFFKHIVRERALELGGEGHRKYDLLRWNLLGKSLTEAKANMTNMSNRTGTLSFTYMAGPPSYATTIANLPQRMYFRNTSTADNSTIWANSLYTASPASAPTGTTSVNWVSNTIGTDITSSSTRYAFGFTPNKSELFPIPQPARDANRNLTQNPGF
jgi:starch-binding outer membrane protein, SusD/RagB family